MVYSLEQRIFLVLEFHRLEHSVVATRRSFQRKFNVTKGPKSDTIKDLFEKFQRTGNVQDERAGKVGRPRTATTEGNAQLVQQVIQQRPRVSVRRVAAAVQITPTSTYRLMRQSLHLYPYKIQTRQPLSAAAFAARETFANDMVQRIDDGDMHVGSIWFTDEAYFYLDGFVNKQNWRIWGTENPHVAVPSSLHPQKVLVWAAISSKGIIGPFFRSETITASRYLDILREFVAVQTALDDTANTSWFMQDGARPHRTADVFNFLNEYFDDRVIALGYPKHTGSGVDWPPYSPDMNPCDFFLWGHLKDQVYRQNPKTIEQLKQYISSACEAIPPDTLSKVSGNFIQRLRHIIATHGGYVENIVL